VFPKRFEEDRQFIGFPQQTEMTSQSLGAQASGLWSLMQQAGFASGERRAETIGEPLTLPDSLPPRPA
jgi:hypothetical protein